MDENAIHQWMLECFGSVQGEMAWRQFSQLPEEIRQQILAQNGNQLPDPAQVKAMLSAFTVGGLNSPSEMKQAAENGPINVKLAKALAQGRVANNNSESVVSAAQSDHINQAMREANLWLDAVCSFDPADGKPKALTRASWVDETLDSWAKFAAPVARSMNDALIQVLGSRFGDLPEGEVAGMFAGPIPIPMPDGLKDPKTLISFLGNTAFAMQLGQAAGQMSSEVHGSFDQGIALSDNKAGALIAQNVTQYAQSLELDQEEVLNFLALREAAHARLYASVPWLMPRFEALIGKYARGIDIDLAAMQDQIDQAVSLDPESMAGAINLGNVAMQDTEEQQEAMKGIETLLALVDGWVDLVVWRAGMAHIPHLEQLREMMRRQRAVGGPAEQTFETLIGLKLRPKRLREAADIWEHLTTNTGVQERDALWSHPDLLPQLPDEQSDNPPSTQTSYQMTTEESSSDYDTDQHDSSKLDPSRNPSSSNIDWDAELDKLLHDEQSGDEGDSKDGNSSDSE